MANVAVNAAPPDVNANAAQATAQPGSTGPNSLDQNAFLTLFTTQLKFQDPMNPMESYELASQLAQFSTVQELSSLNDKMSNVESYLASINNAQMISCIGKQIIAQLDQLQVHDGKASSLSYQLEGPCDVTVNIYDDQDHLVRSIDEGHQDAGQYQFQWDAMNGKGEPVDDGNYRVEIQGVTADGSKVAVQPEVSGIAYAFRIVDGSPYLILNGEDGPQVPIGAIKEVRSPADPAAAENAEPNTVTDDLKSNMNLSNLLKIGGLALALI